MNECVKRTVCFLSCLSILTVGLVSALPQQVNAASPSLIQVRTQEEIVNYYNTHYFSIQTTSDLEQAPDVASDISGRLGASATQEALNALNLMRFAAGLNEVQIHEPYQVLAQHGAVLLDQANTLSHNPGKPAGMSDAFYAKGQEAVSQSNLAFGYENLPFAIIDGWMDDTNPRYVTQLAHRRWMLDPDMTKTGFGKSGSFTQMYAFDGYNRSGFSANYIPWPATNTPSQFFAGNWSIMLNPSLYGPSSDIVVYIKDKSTGRTIRYSAIDTDDFLYSYEPGGKYGRSNAIIFEPSLNTDVGKSYQVQVTGLKSRSGASVANIEYDVNFFHIEQPNSNASIRIPQHSRAYDYTPSEWEDIQGDMLPVGTDSNASAEAAARGERIINVRPSVQTPSNADEDDDEESRLFESGSAITTNSKDSSGKASRKVIDTNLDRNLAENAPAPVGNINLTPEGEWRLDTDGNWQFVDKRGTILRNTWAKLHNPYSATKEAKWFRFNENGRLHTGWYITSNGNIYYLNPVSNGTKGEMLTGWQWLQIQGSEKCFYFSETPNESEGSLLTNTTIGEWSVNECGEWVENGIVMTRATIATMSNASLPITPPPP